MHSDVTLDVTMFWEKSNYVNVLSARKFAHCYGCMVAYSGHRDIVLLQWYITS
jgi:hypothetical protein